MNIYQEKFYPTYLCIKQHSVTGLKYLCRTQKSYEEMLKYKGSGYPYWDNHLKEHGRKHVETLWFCLFLDEESIKEFALMCSEQWNIVNAKDENGKKIWANLIYENGLDGWIKGNKRGPQSSKHITKRLFTILERGATNKNKKLGPQSDDHLLKRVKSLTGIIKGPWSEKEKAKRSSANKGISQPKLVCPHCGKEGGRSGMKRYHFDNCDSILPWKSFPGL